MAVRCVRATGQCGIARTQPLAGDAAAGVSLRYWPCGARFERGWIDLVDGFRLRTSGPVDRRRERVPEHRAACASRRRDHEPMVDRSRRPRRRSDLCRSCARHRCHFGRSSRSCSMLAASRARSCSRGVCGACYQARRWDLAAPARPSRGAGALVGQLRQPVICDTPRPGRRSRATTSSLFGSPVVASMAACSCQGAAGSHFRRMAPGGSSASRPRSRSRS